MRLKTTTAAAALVLFVAGCDESYVQSFASREAGHIVNEGAYGVPTDHNLAVHSGQKQAVIDLSRKFARDVPSTINFAFDSARLDAEARAALDQQARWIRQFPELRFRVYGHTDLVGSEAYNQRLGLRRARAVVDYLASRGVSRSRLEAMASFGETQPLIVTEGREPRNRRTVTEVSGFVARSSDQPLDGKYASLVYRTYVEGNVIATMDREGQR